MRLSTILARPSHYTPASIATFLIVALFVALLVPTVMSASRDIVELSVISTDAPLVFQQLLQMIGPGPNAKSYGDFLPVVLAVGTAPLRWLSHALHFEIPDVFYIVLFRLSQIVCAVLAFVALYRLTAALSSPWMGFIAVAIVATMIEIVDLTVVLHPDIWQLMAELFAIYVLVGAHRHCVATGRLPIRLVVWAAIWTAAATASKVNGIFIAPSIAVVLLGPFLYKPDGQAWSTATWAVIRACMLFLLVFVPVTAALWPMLVTGPVALFSFFQQVSAAFEGLTVWQGIVLLTPEKLATLVSSRLAGPLVAPFFVLGLVIAGLRWVRRPCCPTDPLIVLHASIVPSLGYFFFVFRDTFNVYGSERYIVFVFVLMLVCVLVWSWRLSQTRSKPVGIAVTTLLLVWQSAQAAGLAGVSGLTALYPAVFRSMFIRYGGVTNEEPLASQLRAAYAYDEKTSSYVLRADLSDEQRAAATAIRRLVVGKPTMFSSDFAILPYIRRYARTEDWAGFKIRQWVAVNVEDGKSILVEYYMNLRDEASCVCKRPDLGMRKIFQDRGEIYATAENVRKWRPDYVLTRRKTVAAHLLRELSNYELMTIVSGNPTNLADDAQAAATVRSQVGATTASLKAFSEIPATAQELAADAAGAMQHPPSSIFVLRQTGD